MFNPQPKPEKLKLSGVEWERQKKRMCERDNYTCQECGCMHREELQPHHIKTRGAGGGDELWNLITLCWRCHRLVHDGNLRLKVK